MKTNQNSVKFEMRQLLSSSEELNEFNRRLDSWLGDENKSNLVKEKIPTACRQMSQLVAWTWLEDTGSEAEKKLKISFKKALENQAKYNQPQYSQEISDLLAAKKAEGKLTLAEQYKKLAGAIQEYVYTPELTEYFYFEVAKSFDGYIAFDGGKPDSDRTKIRVGLAYPEQPKLSESQLEELQEWVYGESGGDWAPGKGWIALASF